MPGQPVEDEGQHQQEAEEDDDGEQLLLRVGQVEEGGEGVDLGCGGRGGVVRSNGGAGGRLESHR